METEPLNSASVTSVAEAVGDVTRDASVTGATVRMAATHRCAFAPVVSNMSAPRIDR